MVHGEASSGVARHGTPGSAVWGMVELGEAYARRGKDTMAGHGRAKLGAVR